MLGALETKPLTATGRIERRIARAAIVVPFAGLGVVESRSPREIEELSAAMQRCIGAEHDVSVHGMVFIKPRSLPRTSSGKIARRVCRAEYLSGLLPVLGEWRAGDWRWAGAEGRTP